VISGTEETTLISCQLLLIEALLAVWDSAEEFLELTAIGVIELTGYLFVWLRINWNFFIVPLDFRADF
jgi:hypothetical protein